MTLRQPAGRGAARRRIRLPRRTIRLRLTLLYGGLFLLSGAGLLLITYVLVAHRLPIEVTEHATASAGPSARRASGAVLFQNAPGCALDPAVSTLASPANVVRAQVGQCLAAQRAAELNQLLTESGIALAGMALASIGLGWLVAGRVLRPLRTITATTRSISARSLNARLALRGPDDELKELGDTIDGLLSRLDAAFRAQRQFVASASHELRTPLARQRTLVEVALADPGRSAESLESACRRVLAAGMQQEKLIEALLTLARSERGLAAREPLGLSEIVRGVLDARRDEAEQRGLTVQAALHPAVILGDARLAERLVGNLIDNALRHNLPDGTVTAWCAEDDGCAVLRVTNTGPLIAADDVPRLFQPFERLAAARTAGDGLGLGLAIAGAIADAHFAAIGARPVPGGGLEVEVRFPPPLYGPASGSAPGSSGRGRTTVRYRCASMAANVTAQAASANQPSTSPMTLAIGRWSSASKA